MLEEKGCQTSCGCGGGEEETLRYEKTITQPAKKQVNIEFLYLDLSLCDRCSGTESNLESALQDVSELLQKAGVAVNVEKIHVQSLEQAKALNFVSSPTIRINGRDLQIETKENFCAKCSELSGTETNCRIWSFEGEEYKTAPKSLIIETVLREVYNGSDAPVKTSPPPEKAFENIRNFFAAKSDSAAARTV
jgi:hypothetical protein